VEGLEFPLCRRPDFRLRC